MDKRLEGLKALYILKEGLKPIFCDECKEVQIIEKELKALEIIKNKFEISKPVGFDIEKNKVSCGCLVQKEDLTMPEYYLLKEIGL